MKVIKSNVLIQEIKSDSPVTKVGGFVIPDDQKEYVEAKVISVGSEVKEEVKEGDTILIYPKAGKKVMVDDKEYKVINVSEIILIKD